MITLLIIVGVQPMYVCLCKGITEADLRCATAAGEAPPQALIKLLGLDDDDCCGRCVEKITELTAFASEPCLECPLASSHSLRLDT
jgi:bacterioferritin-associated ferredoxin